MQPGEERREKSLSSTLERLLRVGFVLSGLVSVANGIWMILDPAGWHALVPGPASDYGPLNQHFVRDVGGWYLAGGVLFLFAATNPRRFGGVTLIVMLLANGAHAIQHLADVIGGRVGAGHWATDIPVVVGPVIVLGIMLWILVSLQSSRHALRPEEPEEAEPMSSPEPVA